MLGGNLFGSIALGVSGALVERVIVNAAHSNGELPRPTGDPHVHAMGPDPDRILLLGAGVVCGVGVVSHELSIGGHLARRLSTLTGRGVDVELVGVPSLSVPAAARLLTEIDLGRFDALVVMLGTREAIGLQPMRTWRQDIHELLEQLGRDAPPALPIFMVAIPPLPSVVPLNQFLGPIVRRQLERLNAVTLEACAPAGAHFVPFGRGDIREFNRLAHTSTYSAWAAPIAAHLHPTLDAAVPRRAGCTDEELRQASLDAMDILDSPPTAELDALARVAKNLFGVRGAAVNLIDHDRQHMKAAWGIERTDAPRSESFCSTTVEQGGFVVIEDTRLDPRFSGFPVVQKGVLFYAGYPVEAPNGQRIGTLCLFDNQPRSFTKADKSLLRELALRVQRELWSNSRALAR